MNGRPLTPGEIVLARPIFGDSIDYSKVRLFCGKWWPLQPRRTAMAPTGNIHFHPNGGGYSEDFSKESIGRQAFWIHEMTHVWQAQTKGLFYLPLMRHPFCRYCYEFEPGKPFDRYGLEQQAEIVKDAFLHRQGAHLANGVTSGELDAILPFASAVSSTGSATPDTLPA